MTKIQYLRVNRSDDIHRVTLILGLPLPVVDVIVLQVPTTCRLFITRMWLATLAFLMDNTPLVITLIYNLCTHGTLPKDELRESTVPMRGVAAHRA